MKPVRSYREDCHCVSLTGQAKLMLHFEQRFPSDEVTRFRYSGPVSCIAHSIEPTVGGTTMSHQDSNRPRLIDKARMRSPRSWSAAQDAKTTTIDQPDQLTPSLASLIPATEMNASTARTDIGSVMFTPSHPRPPGRRREQAQLSRCQGRS